MFKTIKVEELEIVGTSVSGHWTCIVVTNYGVAFDMGCLFGESLACDVVCVTHGHSDHVASLAHHLRVRTMRNDKKARYIMPRQCIRQFYALFASLYSLDNHIEDGISLEQAQILLAKQATVSEATIDALSTPSSPPSTTITSSSSSSSLVSTNSTASQSFTARATSPPPMITSVEIRDNLTPPPPTYIEIGKSRFLRCFATNHRVPSVAYCIYERRSQLKVKYRSMPNDVIAAAAKRGEAVSDVTYVAKIAFTGDTIIDGVLMHSELLSVCRLEDFFFFAIK